MEFAIEMNLARVVCGYQVKFAVSHDGTLIFVVVVVFLDLINSSFDSRRGDSIKPLVAVDTVCMSAIAEFQKKGEVFLRLGRPVLLASRCCFK